MSASYDRIAAQLDAADEYVYRWTSQAEADAIRVEHVRRAALIETLHEYREEQKRKSRARKVANRVIAALIGLGFVLAALVWGRVS